MKLSPSTARELTVGGVLRDHEVVGLQLIAGKNRKSWHLYYRTRAGAERRPKLGGFPEMSLNSARAVAKELKERVAKGEDPSAEWQGQRAAPTVNDLCDAYLKQWAPKHNEARTIHENKLLIDRHIRPGLGHKKVADVTQADVDRFLGEVLERKYVPAERRAKDGVATAPSAANHVRTLLSHLFNLARTYFRWSIQKIDGAAMNPVHKTVKQHTEARQRLAEPDELRAILTLLGEREAENPAHVACIWTLFFSGGRVGEIEHALKTQLEGHKLKLKKHKTFKKIGAKTVTLPLFVAEMIGRLNVEGERLFGDIALKRFWDEIRTAAGCPDLQMRDARRTFASYALQCGFTLDVIGRMLHHTNIRTTGGYTWLVEELSDERSEIAEKIAASMLATLKPSAPLAASPSASASAAEPVPA